MRGGGAEGDDKRENFKQSPCPTQPDGGLDLTTLRSRLEPKLTVRRLTD